MWSFVGSKRNKPWLWLALETHSRQIVGPFVGQRDAAGALGLWRSPVYRQCAVIYTDAWEAYRKGFPHNVIVSWKKRVARLIILSGLTIRYDREFLV